LQRNLKGNKEEAEDSAGLNTRKNVPKKAQGLGMAENIKKKTSILSGESEKSMLYCPVNPLKHPQYGC
jgi:hypothetical protein